MCAEYVFLGLLGVVLIVVEVASEYENKKIFEKLLTEPEIHAIIVPEVKGR